MRGVKTKRDLFSLLTSDDNVHLRRIASASMTVLMTPMTVGFLNMELEYLAHTTTRALDTTSHATGTVRQELSHVGEATGEKQAEVDCLLLRQAHGCEQFKGNCHFNQLDNSQLINKKKLV